MPQTSNPEPAACTAFLVQPQAVATKPHDAAIAEPMGQPVCRADLGRDDLTGLSLGQYDLGRRLGAGGMGLVYEALHRHLGKRFAIKFIRNEVSSGEATARFIQEIRTLGTLQHPHLINAIDAGVEQHLPYCVTELLIGRDLGEWITLRGPMPLAAAAEAIRQAAEGLSEAHQQNVIHRDIKPSNLFLQSDGSIKLLDFGLSVGGINTAAATEPGRLLGTVDFMSPEQIQNAHAVTAASDLYSLGATLVYLLTGKLLYDNQQYPETINKLKAIGQSPAQLLKPLESSLDPSIKPLLVTLLEPAAANRCSSARALCEQLSRWASPEALKAWLAGQVAVVPAVAPEQATDPAKGMWLRSAGLAAVVATIVISGHLLLIRRTHQETEQLETSQPVATESLPVESLVEPVPERQSAPISNENSVDRVTKSKPGRSALNAGAIGFSATPKSVRPIPQRAHAGLQTNSVSNP